MRFYSCLFSITIIVACLIGCSTANNRSINGSFAEKLRSEKIVSRSAATFKRVVNSTETSVPQLLLKQSSCVAAFPEVLKAAFIGGGQFGQGIVSCKDKEGLWSPVAFLGLKGGSFGWQIGAESAELVLFFVGENAINSLLVKQVTLGGDVSISAGPVGRGAQGQTNIELNGIYSYAKTKGLFAGISLNGSVLSPDNQLNEIFYGRTITTSGLLFDSEKVTIPKEATAFLRQLP